MENDVAGKYQNGCDADKYCWKRKGAHSSSSVPALVRNGEMHWFDDLMFVAFIRVTLKKLKFDEVD